MLRPEEKDGKEVINGVVKVSLYVNLDDILGIYAMVENGQAIPLYSPVGSS